MRAWIQPQRTVGRGCEASPNYSGISSGRW